MREVSVSDLDWAALLPLDTQNLATVRNSCAPRVSSGSHSERWASTVALKNWFPLKNGHSTFIKCLHIPSTDKRQIQGKYINCVTWRCIISRWLDHNNKWKTNIPYSFLIPTHVGALHGFGCQPATHCRIFQQCSSSLQLHTLPKF